MSKREADHSPLTRNEVRKHGSTVTVVVGTSHRIIFGTRPILCDVY
jgi:hypothetical protein